MDLKAYETEGRARYLRLSQVIASLLNEAIAQERELRLQHVQNRAKELSSVARKLERAAAMDSNDIGAVAKDLAGCRIIFYTNSDVRRFQTSRILQAQFVIDWSRTKIHHPQPDTANAADLFISNNYVVRLNDELLSRPQYQEFRGLWCEIQVQTTLNHAWSEMAHDTIYKTPQLEGFGRDLLQGIEVRMKDIMRQHLLPAGYEFQKVVDDFHRLLNGKEVLEQGSLAGLADCEDNNSRYDLLKRFATSVLPHYNDLEKVQSEVRSAIVDAALQAYETSIRSVETPFGTLPGQDADGVLNVVADILDYIRYSDVEGTLEAICKLHSSVPSARARKRLLRSTEGLSRFQLDIWQQAGAVVQDRLVRQIAAMDRERRRAVQPVVMEVLRQALQTEITGSSATYHAFTFKRAAARPDEALLHVRASAIQVLKQLFQEAMSEEDRFAVAQKFAMAMHPPTGPSDELRKMLTRDAICIVEFYMEVASHQSFELLSHVEHQLLWQYRHKCRAALDDPDAELAGLRLDLKSRIFAFRDLINTDPEYVIHKTLVGFESVSPGEWEGNGLTVEEREVDRKERLGALVSQVNEENAEDWFVRLVRCARTESRDGATFMSMGEFLERLGVAQPGVVLSYLARLEEHFERFIPALLSGLEKAGRKAAVREHIRLWLQERKYLWQVIWYERFAQTVDVDLIDSALDLAIAAGDEAELLKVVGAISARYADVVDRKAMQAAFLRALRCLIRMKDSDWPNAVASSIGENGLFEDMTRGQIGLVLAALLPTPRINYHAEEVLAQIAKRWPEPVIDFFGMRVRDTRLAKRPRYEAVPYEFHLLQTVLEAHPQYAVTRARTWHSQDSAHFEYRGGRFLLNVFPALTEGYEQSLMQMATGSREDMDFVIDALTGYNGDVSTHELSKRIVDRLSTDDPLLDKLTLALERTGTVHGEFGHVVAYRGKIADMQPWLDDARDRVQDFARRYIYSLEQELAAEQRRSEEDLEFRKRSYPSQDS